MIIIYQKLGFRLINNLNVLLSIQNSSTDQICA